MLIGPKTVVPTLPCPRGHLPSPRPAEKLSSFDRAHLHSPKKTNNQQPQPQRTPG
jgi:hypothetical protein